MFCMAMPSQIIQSTKSASKHQSDLTMADLAEPTSLAEFTGTERFKWHTACLATLFK